MPTKTITIDPAIVKAVRSLIDSTTVHGASRSLGISEATVARIAAGIPVTRGTDALVRARLIQLNLIEAQAA